MGGSGTEGGAGPQRPVSLTRRWTYESPQKFGKLTDSSEKAPGPSEIQALGHNLRGTKKGSVSLSLPPPPTW